MKKTKVLIVSLAAFAILSSCATTKTTGYSNNSESTTERTGRHIESASDLQEKKFIKTLDGISVKCESSPKEVSKGRAFAAPFVFKVTAKDGSALADFPITVSYPSSNTAEGITYSTTKLTTDENGKISFTAEKNDFSIKAKVSAYPTPESETESILEKLKPYTAEADWKVKSDIATKGAVLFVWDFNEKGRPENNSYTIQAEFRGRGITMVGNGPVNETSYIGKPKALYKDTYEIIGGNQYGYLIYGTIKFEQPVTALEDESGYFCILKAEIEAVEMKKGSIIYSSTITYESKGKNWSDCVQKAKDNLADLVVDDIIYSL